MHVGYTRIESEPHPCKTRGEDTELEVAIFLHHYKIATPSNKRPSLAHIKGVLQRNKQTLLQLIDLFFELISLTLAELFIHAVTHTNQMIHRQSLVEYIQQSYQHLDRHREQSTSSQNKSQRSVRTQNIPTQVLEHNREPKNNVSLQERETQFEKRNPYICMHLRLCNKQKYVRR